MRYVHNILSKNEQILRAGKFHWIENAYAWIWTVLAALFWIFGRSSVLLALPLTFVSLWLWIRIWTTEIAVTNKRLIYKRGLIWQNIQELGMHKVEEVTFRQGLIGRMLNYGHLVCSGTGGNRIRLPAISAPLEFRRAMMEAEES